MASAFSLSGSYLYKGWEGNLDSYIYVLYLFFFIYFIKGKYCFMSLFIIILLGKILISTSTFCF